MEGSIGSTGFDANYSPIKDSPFPAAREASTNQALVFGVNPPDSNYRVAASAGDGSYGYVYLARGQSVRVSLRCFDAAQVEASWFDPRLGLYQSIGEFPNKSTPTFTPPTNGPGNDWLLVLDAK